MHSQPLLFILSQPLLFVFPAAMIFSALMDLFTMTIPNRVSIALVLAFFGAAFVSAMPLQSVWGHLGCGLLALVITMVMFAQGWLGGGDAKLLSATVLWIGPDDLVTYLIAVTLLGGVLAIAILAYRTMIMPSWLIRQDWALRLHQQGSGIPYGIALAGAGLWVYPATHWFSAIAA